MNLNPINVFLINEVVEDLQEAENEVENIPVRADLLNQVFRHPFDELDENQFIRRYRVTKDLARSIIQLVTPFMEAPSRASALSIDRRVLKALRFYASGGYQEITGSNAYTFISQPSVSRSIREVSQALNQPAIMNRWVRFPGNIQELQTLRERFYNKHGLPGVIGCIDCTHVAIVRPSGDPEYPEHAYVNRKMYHSINVQLVCDDNLKIINCNASFPGSVHDARIWRESNVSRAMEQLYRHNPNNKFFLLGDSGYPLRPWLQTPIRPAPAPGSPEERYNNRLMSIRSLIERCNGVLKNRFRCLLKDRVLHYRPTIASFIINACVVLHNMCIENNIILLLDDGEDLIPLAGDLGLEAGGDAPQNVGQAANIDLEAARALRQQIIDTYFG